MRWRIALLLGLLASGLAAWSLGVFDQLDAASTAARLRESGAWGPTLFVAAFSLANGLGSPAAFFVFPAIAIWQPTTAFLVIWSGSVGAGVIGYAFARTIGRDWVAPPLPLALRDLDQRAARNALRTVLFVRLALAQLGPAHWALGLSSIRPLPLLLGTLLGFLPISLFWGFAGTEVIAAVREGSPLGWFALAWIALLLVVVPRWLARQRARSVAAASGGDDARAAPADPPREASRSDADPASPDSE